VSDISSRVRAAIERARLPRAERTLAPSPDSLAQTIDLDTLGLDRPFTAEDLTVIDHALDLDEDLVAVARPGATASWATRHRHLGCPVQPNEAR
jgi:hypothetical protein